MDLWRKIGVTIIFGIVAIIGGGLFWVLSEDWAVVFTYLSMVGFFLLAFLFNPEQMVNEVAVEEEAGEEPVDHPLLEPGVVPVELGRVGADGEAHHQAGQKGEEDRVDPVSDAADRRHPALWAEARAKDDLGAFVDDEAATAPSLSSWFPWRG